MSLLYGEIKDSFLKTDLKDYMLRNNTLRRRDESLQVSPIDPEGRIDETLGSLMCLHNHKDTQNAESYKVIKFKRVNFKFNQNKFEQYLLSTNINQYAFSKVNSSLFENISGAAVPNQFWDDASKFLSIGVGYSLIKENQPIATAFSSFIHYHMLEIGVETHPDYRKQGYGGIISAKLISYCIEKDLEPIWSCRYGNQGSYNLALKMGFEPTSNIPYYELLT
jgi:GNAT superfamily N-acetyltransferase